MALIFPYIFDIDTKLSELKANRVLLGREWDPMGGSQEAQERIVENE